MRKIDVTFRETYKGDIPNIVLTQGDVTRFVESGGMSALEIGIGPFKNIDRRKFILICRKIIRTAKQQKIKRFALEWSRKSFPKLRDIKDAELASLMAQSFEMANFEFTKFKAKPENGFDIIEKVIIFGETNALVQAGFEKGQLIGEHVNLCRELANTPAGDMTPGALATEAQKAAKGTNIDVSVMGASELKKLKMGAILGVSRGSKEEPKLITMEYRGLTLTKSGKDGSRSRKADPIVLVGKGVTFDSGGLNVKTDTGMLDMHLDMSGGAAVIATLILAARLGLKKNIVGIIPAVENMPSGESYRPGDVLTSLSGKTIEIRNTDAEGRVILADALTYAQEYTPRLIVDVATLTGAAVVALGERASAIMTKNERLQDLFMTLGEESGDYVWPLPLWDEYNEDIKGTFGDIVNTNTKNSRYGGTINGGMFLSQFTEGLPWVHIDMAPRMTSIPGDQLADGAAGEPVRLLLKLLETY